MLTLYSIWIISSNLYHSYILSNPIIRILILTVYVSIEASIGFLHQKHEVIIRYNTMSIVDVEVWEENSYGYS